MIYRKLLIYMLDSKPEKPIAIFDNPASIPLENSIVTLTTNGVIDVAGLEVKPPKNEQLLVLRVISSQDGDIEFYNVQVRLLSN